MKFKLFFLIILVNSVFAQEVDFDGRRIYDSHAAMPGYLSHVTCQSEFDVSTSKSKGEIYRQLRLEGHNLKELLSYKSFRLSHFQDIYRAIKMYPSWMNYRGKSLTYRVYKDYNNPNAPVAQYGNNTIYLNPKRWNRVYDSEMRTAIIFHELAHAIGEKINDIDDAKLWINIEAGWNERYLRSDPTGAVRSIKDHVSMYSMEHPAEDFAESISKYRFDPKVLRKISKRKYNFIKDIIFLGVEFNDDASCGSTAEEVIDEESLKSLLKSKLEGNQDYFNTAMALVQKQLKRKKNPHPEYVKREFAQKSISLAIEDLTNLEEGKYENFLLAHKLKIVTGSVKDFDEYLTDYAKRKLRHYSK